MDLVLQSSDLFDINIIVFKIDTGLAANKNQLIKFPATTFWPCELLFPDLN